MPISAAPPLRDCLSRQMAGPRTRRFFIGLAEEEYEKIEK